MSETKACLNQLWGGLADSFTEAVGGGLMLHPNPPSLCIAASLTAQHHSFINTILQLRDLFINLEKAFRVILKSETNVLKRNNTFFSQSANHEAAGWQSLIQSVP